LFFPYKLPPLARLVGRRRPSQGADESRLLRRRAARPAGARRIGKGTDLFAQLKPRSFMHAAETISTTTAH